MKRSSMVRAFLLSCASLVVGSSASANSQTSASLDDNIARLEACRTRPEANRWIRPKWVPIEEVQAEEAWMPATSKLDAHLSLRGRIGLPMPSGQIQILIFRRSEHWVAVEESFVATRDPNGRWQVEKVLQVNVGTGSEDETIERVTMSRLDSRTLDEYLGDPCLLAEPAQSEWSALSSSTYPRWTLEFRGVAENRILSRADDGFGISERILELIS